MAVTADNWSRSLEELGPVTTNTGCMTGIIGKVGKL
jgi:hypothetical protein